MANRKKIIALCGSTRAQSTNLNYINAFAELTRDTFEISLYPNLSDLPHFNPDHDTELAPAVVQDFRAQLKQAQGILICTPEYAMGVPGTLKNAIDWTVSSMEFSHKPTALITASSLGQKAHASLQETLKIIEAAITPQTQLLISHAKTKINEAGILTDAATVDEMKALAKALYKLMQ